MQIHRTDPAAIAPRCNSVKDWREIGQLVAERAIHREGVVAERKGWGLIQQEVGMEE